jgi:hypothetical protein
LIHDERNSPLPYVANQASPATPNNAYELIKMELQFWRMDWVQEKGSAPSDDEMQHEACRIIFGAEALPRNSNLVVPSWVRDLVLSKHDITTAAMFRPVRTHTENRMSELRVNGKDNIFESCELETGLQDFVKARQLLGLTAMDHELQVEACRIIGRMEEKSNTPCEEVANWLLRLIYNSTDWLLDFRRRASLPRSEDIVDDNLRSKDPKTIDSTIHNYSRLERELAEYMQLQRSLGTDPPDADLQREARAIIYDSDDDWNQTAADDAEWLGHFRERHPPAGTNTSPVSNISPAAPGSDPSLSSDPKPAAELWTPSPAAAAASDTAHQAGMPRIRTGAFFLTDANCYRRLSKSLSRFVAATMSSNNPNSHVPTDLELQHQARWIIYDE